MSTLDSLLDHFLQHPAPYLMIPLVGALLGWATNALAIRMLFYPLDFIGIPPRIGWQGVVPRHAGQIAGDLAEMVSRDLLTPAELMRGLDVDLLVHALEKPLLRVTNEIVEDVMQAQQPALWTVLPVLVRRRILKQLGKEVPKEVREIFHAVQQDIDQVLDVRRLVITNLALERRLLTQPFLDAAEVEFRFIRRTGLLCGFLLGLLQMLLWIACPAGWVLPVMGMAIGLLTTGLALWLIFFPKLSASMGPIRVQGLLDRRHAEIAAGYGRAMVDVVTARRILRELLTGPGSARISELVAASINRVLDERAGLLRTYISLRDGEEHFAAIKAALAQRIWHRLPEVSRAMEAEITAGLQLDTLLVERIRLLSADQMAMALRPAVSRHAPVLIGAAALIGFAVGWFQIGYVFAGVP